MKKHKKQIFYYKSFSDDFVESRNQNYTLPEDYTWIRDRRRDRVAAAILYFIAGILGRLYSTFILHLQIKRSVNMKDFADTGIIVYANHTQPFGDVTTPLLACKPKRIYTVAGPSNMGIPVIGKTLPWMGILPTSTTMHGTQELIKAVRRRLSEGNSVIIYPEAHVWPYYTEIRPFGSTSFSFAVESRVPVFCMTSTYQKRWHGKRPKTTVYLDGPFYADSSLSKREQKEQLREDIFAKMKERSKLSNYSYIEYRPAGENDDDE